jgi:hypothetical protein
MTPDIPCMPVRLMVVSPTHYHMFDLILQSALVIGASVDKILGGLPSSQFPLLLSHLFFALGQIVVN